MVSVLKFQAVGSLEYTFKLAEDDEKLESRCRRRQRKGKNKNGILLPKLFRPTVRKNCSSDLENFLKFEAEGPKIIGIQKHAGEV